MDFLELINLSPSSAYNTNDPMERENNFLEELQYLSYANGVMTAVVASPEPLYPSEWMPHIINKSVDPVSIEEARLAINLLFLNHTQIKASLAMPDQVYEPYLWQDELGECIASDWAEGFCTGIVLNRQAWKPIFKDAQGIVALMPIFVLEDKLCLRSQIDMSELDEQKIINVAQEDLPKSVQYIYDYWQVHNSRKSESICSSQKNISRNQSCPCGSGREYKKCCLN